MYHLSDFLSLEYDFAYVIYVLGTHKYDISNSTWRACYFSYHLASLGMFVHFSLSLLYVFSSVCSVFLCFLIDEISVSLSSVWGDSMPYSLQAPSEAQQAQPLWDSSSSATEEARGASESGWSRQKVRGSLIWKPSTPPYLPLWDSS